MQVKMDKISGDALGTGRRKTSVARVRLRAGSGNITINKRPLEEYFPADQQPGSGPGRPDRLRQLQYCAGGYDQELRLTGP